MATLYSKIKEYLGRDFETIGSIPDVEVKITNDGTGDKLTYWSDSIEKSQPTDEQLNALESQANDMEALKQVYANRRAEYPSVQDLVVALYDADDKAAIDAKRTEIKLKYPKPGA